MMDQKRQRIHAIVDGRVQGVGFRYFTQERAILLGLTGWVRNRWNGTVDDVIMQQGGDVQIFESDGKFIERMVRGAAELGGKDAE